MFKYAVLKQCSVRHNLAWRQRLVAQLSQEEYIQIDTTFERKNGDWVTVKETPDLFVIEFSKEPNTKLLELLLTIYAHESSGLTIDVQKLAKEFAIAAAAIAGFLVVTTVASGVVDSKYTKIYDMKNLSSKNAENALREYKSYSDGVTGMQINLREELVRNKDFANFTGTPEQLEKVNYQIQGLLSRQTNRFGDRLGFVRERLFIEKAYSIDDVLRQTTEKLYAGVAGDNKALYEAYLAAEEAKKAAEAAKLNFELKSGLKENLAQNMYDDDCIVFLGGTAITGSALVLALSNLKTSKPTMKSARGVRASMRYPTVTSPNTFMDKIQEMNARQLGGAVDMSEWDVDGALIKRKGIGIVRVKFKAWHNGDTVDVQVWQEKGSDVAVKELEPVHTSAKVCTEVFEAFREVFMAPLEGIRSATISTDPLVKEEL